MSPTTVEPTAGEKLLHKYVFHHNDPKPFAVQPEKQRVSGPSPYAKTPGEGPSVLKEWEPKRSTGALDAKYKYFEYTPQLGREYVEADLTEVLKDDKLIHDLAVTISERGVVFFRNQEKLTAEEQKELITKLGHAGGAPKTSGRHIHPIALSGGLLDESGEKIDPEVFLINNGLINRLYRERANKSPVNQQPQGLATPWHSDITFEPVPASYSALRLIETPSSNGTDAERAREGGGEIGGSGGDTLWASAYGLAEKLSPKFLELLEGLQGEFAQPGFKEAAAYGEFPFYNAPRGAPENIGDELVSIHPLVRTNPTTGWKAVFAVGHHFSKILGLHPAEAYVIQKHILDTLLSNQDLQLRFKWNPNDIAIWDNRATYHSAIYEQLDGERTGLRTIALGERPFLDPKSQLRTDALKERKEKAKAE